MTLYEFNAHVDKVKERISVTLQKKGDEYAPNSDRLQNFKDGGKLLKETSESYLIGLVTKHYLSVIDCIHQLEIGIDTKPEVWTEKTGDIINYMIILEAIIHERQSDKNII